MMKKLLRASLIATCCLLGIARAEPSTQPSKGKSSLTDRDSTLQTSQQHAFQFRVPKEWKAIESTVSAGVEIHGYDMLAGKPDTPPPAADKSKSKKSRGSSGSSGSYLGSRGIWNFHAGTLIVRAMKIAPFAASISGQAYAEKRRFRTRAPTMKRQRRK